MDEPTTPAAPAWHVLLHDLVQQTTGSSLVPTPRSLTDLSGRYHEPLASLKCRSIADARTLARHLAPASTAPDRAEPVHVEDGLCVSVHVQYRGWWLMVQGEDPAQTPAAVAAAIPDAEPAPGGAR